jgi:hypothetical protein
MFDMRTLRKRYIAKASRPTFERNGRYWVQLVNGLEVIYVVIGFNRNE